MNRITRKTPDGLSWTFPEYMMIPAINKLAAYENTGLTPDEVETLHALTKSYPSILGAAYKLKDYQQAEAEGRLIVLPCDANVTLRYKGLEYKADHWNPPYLTAFADDLTVPSKKRLHLFSPEAAEAALKEAQGK